VNLIPDELDANTVRGLGQALIGRARAMEEVGRRGRLRLTDEGIQRLAEMLCRGDRPTLGFYRRNRAMDDG
jgi:hypothetical protein